MLDVLLRCVHDHVLRQPDYSVKNAQAILPFCSVARVTFSHSLVLNFFLRSAWLISSKFSIIMGKSRAWMVCLLRLAIVVLCSFFWLLSEVATLRNLASTYKEQSKQLQVLLKWEPCLYRVASGWLGGCPTISWAEVACHVGLGSCGEAAFANDSAETCFLTIENAL